MGGKPGTETTKTHGGLDLAGSASVALERRLGRRTRRQLRGKLLGRTHLLPDFLVIGALRCGAVRLFHQLEAHPNLLESPTATHFFHSHRYTYGTGWYRLRFPANKVRREAYRRGLHPVLTGEADPSYLAHPAAPTRVARAVPGARLLVLLRDPTERAVSHWAWRRRHALETRDFRAVVEAEIGPPGDEGGIRVPIDKAYEDPLVVRRGLYQASLERWRTHFPDDQLLVIETERWFDDPAPVIGDVCDFLGLPRPTTPLPAPPADDDVDDSLDPVDEDVVARLRTFYRAHNEELARYLDLELDWDDRSA
jgi:hypothetical protein